MLKKLEVVGFKSFGKKSELSFTTPITAVVGPNGSGKSNVVEAIRFVLGEQSMRSLRGKSGADLIFKGSKILPKLSRASVSISFDNRKRLFKLSSDTKNGGVLEYDEVKITREIFADGASRYAINDSDVRLKDVVELLGSVNIGSSGHHIISQGEADRVLSASSRDRREMIEDALGLKVYQYKIRESERKLDKTATNMKEVTAIRREIAPHIVYLKKQVEKIQKSQELRDELLSIYRTFFTHEAFAISRDEKKYQEVRREHTHALEGIDRELHQLRTLRETSDDPHAAERVEIEQLLKDLSVQKDELSRRIGRLEGMIEIEEKRTNRETTSAPLVRVSWDALEPFVTQIETRIDDALLQSSLDRIASLLSEIKLSIRQFVGTHKKVDAVAEPVDRTQLDAYVYEKETLKGEQILLSDQESALRAKLSGFDAERIEVEAHIRHGERELFALEMKKRDVSNELALLALKEEQLAQRRHDMESSHAEALVLVGAGVESYKELVVDDAGFAAQNQEDTRRRIERLKIKLEESGAAGGGDTVKEYNDLVERDQFLLRELDDLSQSMKALEDLISDLKEKLTHEFNEGIEKINAQFTNFFARMFGGGSAFLSVVVEKKRSKRGEENDEEEKDEDETLDLFERGIEIHVNLPTKKVKDLQMLSGGERSLASIALLFAISQVNPPPCLVLDETDAALDEANSRRYGDMLEALAQYSQLIVITHNRETMSRAQVLYGVTVGAEGASKLLSIKFDEAAQIAK